LYREEGLQLRRKTPKRKVSAKRREDRVIAAAANDCWSMDFLSDQLFDGRKLSKGAEFSLKVGAEYSSVRQRVCVW
jgi:hypothetical protein